MVNLISCMGQHNDHGTRGSALPSRGYRTIIVAAAERVLALTDDQPRADTGVPEQMEQADPPVDDLSQLFSSVPVDKKEIAGTYLFQDGAVISDLYSSIQSKWLRTQIDAEAIRLLSEKNLDDYKADISTNGIESTATTVFDSLYQSWQNRVVQETMDGLVRFVANNMGVDAELPLVKKISDKASGQAQKESLERKILQAYQSEFKYVLILKIRALLEELA